MNEVFNSPFFGISICILTYQIGRYLNRKLKSPLANPMLIAMILIIAFLKIFNISYDQFNQGGQFISLFLAPATACLGVSVYKQLDVLKKNILPILLGCTVGSLTSIVSVYCLCKLFKLDEKFMISLIPKSVTTPIDISITEQHGGMVPITVLAILVTGLIGAIFAPLMIRIFRVKNPVAAGIAIGTSSHALGTSKAVEIGEIEGAMSSLAIGIAGLVTVFFSIFL
ncbi:MAG TPA: LrgB family protein [Defluviitaleaceae bacterium]|nr:LrgB family protein [Defluviitaleaceae bacterium]